MFAALDVGEMVHQVHESRTGLVILALALALLHAGVSVVAGAALRAPEVAVGRLSSSRIGS